MDMGLNSMTRKMFCRSVRRVHFQEGDTHKEVLEHVATGEQNMDSGFLSGNFVSAIECNRELSGFVTNLHHQ